MFAKILDLLFPRTCLGCGAPRELLCESCVANLPIADNDRPNCRARFSYSHRVTREAIWQLKYKHKYGFAHILGTALGELLLEDLVELAQWEGLREPLLVPVPLSPKRLRERGYNQALLIAEAVAKVTGLKLQAGLVFKARETPTQVSQHNRTKRLKNLSGVFGISDPALAAGKNIILIDDVYTTGATASELTRVFKQSAAMRVLVYTVAH